MPRFSNTLSGIRINPAQHEALHGLAEQMQTSASSVVRMALAKFLAEHGFGLSSQPEPQVNEQKDNGFLCSHSHE